MKRLTDRAIAYAEARGFTFERENSKGVLYYRNANGVELGIGQNLADHALRRIMRDADKAAGVAPDPTRKRNTGAIKARQERERAEVKAERARHQARLDELARDKRELLLAGLGEHLTYSQVLEIERLIEAEERAHRELVTAMTTKTGVTA